MSGTVAFIVKGYPRLSETFIAEEIRGLEARGLDIHIVSLRHPTDSRVHPVHERINAPVLYLPEYLYREPLRVWRAFRAVRKTPAYRTARAIWLGDLRRDLTSNRVRRFGQALVLAHELPAGIDRLHAHFLHTPASVARYAAALTGLPWTCSAHAVDIYTTPDWEKREKLASCDWLVTCTAANRDHLAALAPDPGKVSLVYHGLNMETFATPMPARPSRDGSDPDDPVTILSVGRAVAKKGYDDLLKALSLLPDDVHWRLVHIGGGPLIENFKKIVQLFDITERIYWLGAQSQAQVIENYRRADLFALACKIAPNGDRDGLPNVLVEAQSQGLACVATNLSAIPELIEDGRTGRLVEPESPERLASAIEELIRNPDLRARLGAAGRDKVISAFSADAGLDRLADLFGVRRAGQAA